MNWHELETASLADTLIRAVAPERLGFHMPGHAGGRGLPEALIGRFGRLDTTELPHTDNLAQPENMLLAAQERAARLFGAARTHFLVNGATGGILAMVQAVVGPGDVLLVGRDCHRSVLQAIRLSGATPVFVAATHPAGVPLAARAAAVGQPELPCGPSSADWLRAIAAHPEAKALLLTRPNYYGTAVALSGIVQAAHAADIRVLVDEAHGTHFIASDAFPEPALACGADLVVQSLHKTLPAPTQTALLHEAHTWTGPRRGLPVASLAEAVALFQTTSPSWMLLVMMDAAVGWLANQGEAAYAGLLDTLRAWRLPGCVDPRLRRLDASDVPDGFRTDPTRLVLHYPRAGTILAQTLWQRHGIAVEMADIDHLVLITTPFHNESDFHMLGDALTDAVPIARMAADAVAGEPVLAVPPLSRQTKRVPADAGGDEGFLPEQVMSMTEALCKPRQKVPLPLATGAVAAAPVVPYPPGVAAIVPGERFDAAVVAELLRLQAAGVSLNGVEDGAVWCVHS